MKYKIAAFFEGRNGLDALSKMMIWASLIVMLVGSFIPVEWLQSLLAGLAWAALILGYYRVFSKKLDKRQAENDAYLSWCNRMKLRWTQRKTHKIYRCPKCKKTLRVPKGKGKISITCSCCGEKFIKKS